MMMNFDMIEFIKIKLAFHQPMSQRKRGKWNPLIIYRKQFPK